MPIEKAVVRYCCNICDADFKTRKEAESCEKRKNETLPSWMKAGKEIVTDFFCGACRVGFTIGKIKKIVGLVLPDENLEIRCICRPERKAMHVYYVYVVGRCGCCRRKVRLIKAPSQIQENKRF